MDHRTSFDHRLDALNSSTNCSVAEIDGAVKTFERLKTATEIVKSAVGNSAVNNTELLVAVFNALCAECNRLSVITDE